MHATMYIAATPVLNISMRVGVMQYQYAKTRCERRWTFHTTARANM